MKISKTTGSSFDEEFKELFSSSEYMKYLEKQDTAVSVIKLQPPASDYPLEPQAEVYNLQAELEDICDYSSPQIIRNELIDGGLEHEEAFHGPAQPQIIGNEHHPEGQINDGSDHGLESPNFIETELVFLEAYER